MQSFAHSQTGQRGLKSALLIGVALTFAGAPVWAAPISWRTVANNGNAAPQSKPQARTPYFFSYNQPAVNALGQVVFRARAKPLPGAGGGAEPTRGVYTRALVPANVPIYVVADNLGVAVPAPNTTGAAFIEFPSTPRSDAWSNLIASRGQSQPVVTLPDGSKLGTAGVYASARAPLAGFPTLNLTTAASQAGALPAYSQFQVPGAPAGTRFDQFPGAPSPFAGRSVAFKGNYTVGGVGMTGAFYRDLIGATQPIKLIARSGDAIPSGGGKKFGSIAPPSAAVNFSAGAKYVVFAGFDNEEAPTAGGLYVAEPGKANSLRTLVSIGAQVPGQPAGAKFKTFGEGLSFDGHLVAFWGAWGAQTRIVHKDCPTDGNADLLAYCRARYPNGADLAVPVNQGVFIVNIETNAVSPAARTGADGFTDFLYWTYSGKPPGGAETEDAEPPRWRASAFAAVSANALAFKGQKGALDGLYVRRPGVAALVTALDANALGQSVDPQAPAGSKIVAIGLERDGLRGRWLAITASMLNAAMTESWAGVYVHDCGTNCAAW